MFGATSWRTFLRKLDEQGLDALILAQAGLERLGLENVVTEILDPKWMLPAIRSGSGSAWSMPYR